MSSETTEMKEILDEVVQRIVATAHPDKIILFGSAARGELRSHSDLDLLVVKSGDFHRGKTAGTIYRSLHGVNASVDVVVVKPEDIEKYRDCPYTVLYPALREGKVVYAA